MFIFNYGMISYHDITQNPKIVGFWKPNQQRYDVLLNVVIFNENSPLLLTLFFEREMFGSNIWRDP